MSMMKDALPTGRAAAGALLGVLALLVTLPSLGQQGPEPSRIYAGAGLAGVDFDDRYQGAIYGDTSTGWQIYGGYRLGDRTAIEAAYKSFGNLSARDVAGSGIERLDVSAALDVAVVRALWALPMAEVFGWRREFSLFGTLGYYSATTKRRAVELNSLVATSASARDSGLAFGGGVIYRLGRVELRGHFERLAVDRIDRARDVGVAVQFTF